MFFDITEVVNSFGFWILTISTFSIPCITIRLLQFKPTTEQNFNEIKIIL